MSIAADTRVDRGIENRGNEVEPISIGLWSVPKLPRYIGEWIGLGFPETHSVRATVLRYKTNQNGHTVGQVRYAEVFEFTGPFTKDVMSRNDQSSLLRAVREAVAAQLGVEVRHVKVPKEVL